MKKKETIVGTIDREVLAFTAGRDVILDRVLVEADCIGTAAHVRTLAGMALPAPILAGDEARAVIRELVGIVKLARRGKFRITERDQDVHLAVERRLTERLGDLGKKVHTGRSRNDQVAVDLRLYAKEAVLGIFEACAALTEELTRFGRRHARVPMVGRTHLQPAMPTSVGVWATAHAESLLDDLVILRAAYDINDRCPLGSAAGYGVPLPLDRRLTADLLGFRDPIHNVTYASNARGKCEAAVLNALAQLMLTLSRLAEDLILYSMPEFGYFRLPAELCTGSSIMPQKKNPDVLELVRAKAARVLADASAVSGIIKALAGGYNRDLQETKEPFLAGLETTRASLAIMAQLVASLGLDRDALRRGFTPPVFATDRALELVAAGMPFRDAYNHVREHLEELDAADPAEAVKAKTHLGASAGLDFGYFRGRTGAVKRFVKAERSRYYARVSKLLGVRYPAVEAAE
jgi:argininosuccinate lyase